MCVFGLAVRQGHDTGLAVRRYAFSVAAEMTVTNIYKE